MRSAITFLLAFALLAGPAAGDEKAPPRKPLALRVASFNAWLIPLVSQDMNARRDKLAGCVRPLALDVLCLQEIWTPQDQRRIATALKPQLPHAVPGKGGLMMVSRYPVVSSRFIKFPLYEGLNFSERIAGKGLLEAVVETPAGRMRVITSHLALAFGPDNPRTKQLHFFLRHLADLRDRPLVVPADLNTWPVEKGRLTADYQALLEPGLIDANPPVLGHDRVWRPGKPTRLGWPRPDKKITGWFPDHILFRSGASGTLTLRKFAMALDTKETAISDHNLLYADFVLTPAPTRKKSKK